MILKNSSNRGETKSHIRTYSPLAAYGAVFVTTLMWAGSGVCIKLILSSADISEYSLAFYRDIFTFIILFSILLISGRGLLKIDKQDLPWFALLGGLGLGAFHLLWNFGVHINGVAVSTVQQAVMPIILAVAGRFIFKESLSLKKFLAVILTLAGSFFISGLLRREFRGLGALGISVGFAIPLTYALFNLFSKKLRGTYHPLTILTYGFGFGALVLLPIQFFVPLPVKVPAVSWLYLGGLVIISTILPFSLYTAVLRKVQVSAAGLLAMAEIPVAFLYAVLFFNETLSPFQWIGTVLIIGGVALFIFIDRPKMRHRKTADFNPPV